MTGPASSVALGSTAALVVSGFLTMDATWIAVFGGAGGLSRWLWLALNGLGEPWYKGVGHAVLSVLFVTGIWPIAHPLLGVAFSGSELWDAMPLDPNSNLGVAYFIGMFTTVLIGTFEDRIKTKRQKAGKK
tara:strand:- start:2689 stop:3081 length:393 start_codon:yes stop_codon:yes gene_type:complete